jgi:hypothetical protein
MRPKLALGVAANMKAVDAKALPSRSKQALEAQKALRMPLPPPQRNAGRGRGQGLLALGESPKARRGTAS